MTPLPIIATAYAATVAAFVTVLAAAARMRRAQARASSSFDRHWEQTARMLGARGGAR